jgi:integrase
VGSKAKRNKNKQTEFVFNTKSKRDMVLQKSQIEENNNNLFSSSTNTEEELERKIDSITTGLSRPYFNKILKELVKKNLENAIIICDYITAEQIEINIQSSTKESKIKVLTWLSNHFQDEKSFRNMTKHDILNFLNKLRKPAVEDPVSKWIGSYNGRQIILTKFFRWLYNPDEPDHRNRITPSCMQGIKRLPRKEKTSYKPTDIWEPKDNSIFLKYCPSKRDRCYQSLAFDMSARCSEILNLRIKDIKFHVNEEGIQYAEVRITGGKTGSRTVPLIDSLPYLKEWLQEHPTNSNPDSWIFISQGNNHGRKLTYEGLSSHYEYYKKRYFPSLLEDITIPDADKLLIRNILVKPWNLHVYRHSALTSKSQILTEAVLRSHAGWTMSSKMPQVYIHLSNESSKILLQKRGILRAEDKETQTLQSKQYQNCFEPNKPDGSPFCIKCKMILSYDKYNEIIEEKQRKENEITRLKSDYENGLQNLREEMDQKFNNILSLISDNPKLVNVKRDILEKIISI